jgi:tRNA(Ile2) C34 agmatinyltransferase TiaS
MAMSQKNYEAVAAAFKREVVLIATLREGSEIRKSATFSVENLIASMVAVFATDNVKFKEDVFRRACGQVKDAEFDIWRIPVSEPQRVRSIYDNSKVVCKKCGSEEFFPMGRSLDYENWKCVSCGTECCTLTETGASR